MRVLDIPSGAGGLSRGLALAGFQVDGVELDADACDTHRRRVGPCEQADMRTYHPRERFAVVAGGPPCQPFSMAGQHFGVDDPRYLVPDFLRIAREAQADAIMIENVRGLVHDAKSFRIVLDAVEAEWLAAWTVLDAADFGVPQHRDRLFIVGFRAPRARHAFRWPMPSHAPPGGLFGEPYRSSMSAIGVGNDRPSPCVTATEHKSAPRGTQPMSRRRRASERLAIGRRLTVAECATLQDMDGWTFTGDIGSQYRQVGNAVPPALAEAVGGSIMAALRAAETRAA